VIRRAIGVTVSAGIAVAGVGACTVLAAGALTGGVQTLAVGVDQLPMVIDEPITGEGESPGQTQNLGTANVSSEWLTKVGGRTGVDERALLGYANAALVLKTQRPACKLGWSTLAAIGAIESGHGTHGKSGLDVDGRATVAIIGPALNGQGGYAAIRPSAEAAARHGDSQWDRAVGPFQFIGDTWARWQADGDGDGIADPQDIDDAALAAGRYLCASGGDLSTPDGWRAAVFSYNHSTDYVVNVLAVANSYAK